jgi:holo-[acyl-carrier protein] synthase
MHEQHDLVAGLGVDIVEIERFSKVLERRPRIKERLFSQAERAYCEGKNRPEIHYALRFAAKEAVLKTLGTGFAGIRFRDVEVVHDQKGKPIPILTGKAQERADGLGIVELHLSLSYTHATAIASAVAITQAARPVFDSNETPEEGLARTFSELRTMLDTLQDSAHGLAEQLDEESGEHDATPDADGHDE